jgi:hypothetical protein
VHVRTFLRARTLFLRRGACGSERPDMAATAARGLLRVLDAVALAATSGVPNRLANEAPAVARSLFLRRGACGGSERPDLAPTAARGLLHVLDAVALAATSGVPNRSPNAIITARIDFTQ